MRIRKALVIKTEQEENGCVQIRHTDLPGDFRTS